VFDEKTKKVAYNKQTQAVEGKNKSNCPLCAVGDNANKARIYDLEEMDADHIWPDRVAGGYFKSQTSGESEGSNPAARD